MSRRELRGIAHLHSDRLWCSSAVEVLFRMNNVLNSWNIAVRLEICGMKISSRNVNTEPQVRLWKVLSSSTFHCLALPCVFVYVSFQDVDLLCFLWSILWLGISPDIIVYCIICTCIDVCNSSYKCSSVLRKLFGEYGRGRGSVYCVVETADRNVSGSSGASWSRTGYLVNGLTDFVLCFYFKSILLVLS